MTPDLLSYDHVIVAFSGGKDSIACVLEVLDRGIKPELWHHDVDGGRRFMDWPVTTDYCRKFAAALDLPIYLSWRIGGFEQEMLRNGTPTAATVFETPSGMAQSGGKGPAGTRMKFPQVSANLSTRWCSAALKIDVFDIAIRNQQRFQGKRVLVITGERAQESSNRAKYATFEPHRAHSKTRHVDVWRAIHGWTESEVWAALERWRINPHPAYRLGWGRLSCKDCIFASPNQLASSRAIDPKGFERIAIHEIAFSLNIVKGARIDQRADRGRPYEMDDGDVRAAMSETFDEPIQIENWKLPRGAFGESAGPT